MAVAVEQFFASQEQQIAIFSTRNEEAQKV